MFANAVSHELCCFISFVMDSTETARFYFFMGTLTVYRILLELKLEFFILLRDVEGHFHQAVRI